MKVEVHRVNIPAMSTIGYGWGTDVEDGSEVQFAGDHRPMRHLGEALAQASEPIEVELEDWQILERKKAS
jgi:hypothetical protein